MGVHGLWPVLAPASQSIPLSRLAGRTLAVDLSGWVCQAIKTKALAQKVAKPHLRNLFFRVTTFYRLGASLVFVVDGEATQLKWAAMETRGWEGGEGERRRRRTGRRPHLQSYVNECCRLLDYMGVPYLQSKGEAEALCSLLNSTGFTDGVLTNDSDAFLYGAKTIYRDLSTSGRSPQVECYTMQAIQDTLGLCRNDLVALGLLLGCDYCPQGVMGIGKETALRFIRACKSHDQSCDLLDMFRQWRTGTITKGDLTSKVEQLVYRKAMTCLSFPREEVISEFLIAKDNPPLDRTSITTWRRPQILALQLFCHQHMEWEEQYTIEKATSLVTQWILRQATLGERGSGVRPKRIVKPRQQCGTRYYEVQWEKSSEEERGIFAHGTVITLELEDQMLSAYPEMCAAFQMRQEEEAQEKARVKEEVKALAKKHRQEKAAANRKSHRKATSPSSPQLPEFLHNMALRTPPTPCGASPLNDRATVSAVTSKTTDRESDSDTIHVQATGSDCSILIARGLDSDSEEELPSLGERLRAKGVCQEKPLCQTNLLSMFRSVRSVSTVSKLPYSSFTASGTKAHGDMETKWADGETERHEIEKERITDDTGPSEVRRPLSELSAINTEFKGTSTVSRTASEDEACNPSFYPTSSVLSHTNDKEGYVWPCSVSTELDCCSLEPCAAEEYSPPVLNNRTPECKRVTTSTVTVDECSNVGSPEKANHVIRSRLSPKKIALSTTHGLPVEECIVLEDSSDDEGSELPLSEQLRSKEVAKKTGTQVFPHVRGVLEESGVMMELSREGSSHNPIIIT